MAVSPETPGDEEFVTIARVVKTQGRVGEVAAALLTDFPDRFATRKKLFALPGSKSAARPGIIERRRELELQEHWFHKGMVVLKFAGVDSITEAEALIGYEIQVPFSERAKLAGDEFYISDLAGCTVTDSGREIGKIRDVQFGSGEAPLLVVQGEKEQLIPFAAAYIEKVDLERRQVKMKLPEGMLELDAPLRQKEKQGHEKKSG
ncbi:MAG TPA: ribosome maturation factor RimM [Candidatus Angelobacter sp.]|nr:ribosome maturation factor RimM [Candidatus Angelobacter sp.]